LRSATVDFTRPEFTGFSSAAVYSVGLGYPRFPPLAVKAKINIKIGPNGPFLRLTGHAGPSSRITRSELNDGRHALMLICFYAHHD
jgi:hypothetical protein